jgi:predicted ATPase
MAQGADRRPLEIVLTGGACGGKTTALSALAHLLRTRGVHPITVPEAFTLIVSGGVSGVGDMVRTDGSDNCRFQAELFRTIRRMRTNARRMADQFGDQPTVILYDRGELDAIAFHAHECFDDLAAEEGMSLADVRDSYDAVMHLVTTADGAEEFYSAVTNAARWETVDEARASDRRILEAWSGHPRLRLIDNRTDFDGKIARLLDAVMATVDEVAAQPAAV